MKDLTINGLFLCALMLSLYATIALDSSTLLEVPVKINSAGLMSYDVIPQFDVSDKADWVIGIVPVNKPVGVRGAQGSEETQRAAGHDRAQQALDE